MADKPKLSVAVTAYNLEQFIEQSIKSVLDQKTNFKYEIIIGEDCSKDDTKIILEEIKNKFPAKIQLLINDSNLGSQMNLMNVIENCSGEFIAILDGDDYWTDPRKLQKQVDFLEKHPTYSMCTTAGFQKFEDNKNKKNTFRAPGQKDTYTIEDILQDNFVLTSSVVFRNQCLERLPPGYYEFPMTDWPLWVELSRKGPIGYIDDVTMVYRIHSSNEYGTLNEIEKTFFSLEARKTMLDYIDSKYHKYCYHSLFNYYKKLMYMYVEIEDALKVREYANKSLKLIKYYQFNPFWQFLRLSYFSFYIPKFHKYTYSLLKNLKRKL